MMLTRETVNQSRARLLSRFFHPKVQKRALNLQRRIARSCSIIGSRETCFLLQPPLDALRIRSITTLETGFSLPSSPNNLVPSSNMNSNPRFRFNFFFIASRGLPLSPRSSIIWVNWSDRFENRTREFKIIGRAKLSSELGKSRKGMNGSFLWLKFSFFFLRFVQYFSTVI